MVLTAMDWTEALCRNHPRPQLWFPPENQPGIPLPAARTCNQCAIRTDCETWGRRNATHGIWGGHRLDNPTRQPTTTQEAATIILSHYNTWPEPWTANQLSAQLGLTIQATRKALTHLTNTGTLTHHHQPNPRPSTWTLHQQPHQWTQTPLAS